MKPLDVQFVRRVYRTTAWVTMALAILFWLHWGSGPAGALVAGCAVTTACLWLTEIGVRRHVRPGVRNLKPLLLYAAPLWPLLIVAVWILASVRTTSLAAAATGIALPSIVIVLKVVGRNLLAWADAHSDSQAPSGESL